MAGSPVSLCEAIRAGVDAAVGDIHTCLPGRVVSYDAETCQATVKPMVKRALYDVDDDERTFEDLPEIPKVLVMWPRAGAYAITFPLAAGDSVLLIFAQRSIAEWRTGGDVSEPADARTHSIGHPFAIPGAFPDTDAMSTSPLDVAAREAGVVVGQHAGNGRIEIGASIIKIGKDATDFVALATPTQTGINAAMAQANAAMASAAASISAAAAMISTFNSHTHTVAAAPGPTSPPVSPAAAAPSPGAAAGAPGAVTATRVKAK